MRKGDIVLVTGSPLYGKIISEVTRSKWTHTAVAISDNKLLEANEDGVVIVHSDIFFPRYEEFVILRPKKNIVDIDKFVNDCYRFLGTDYAWWQVIIDFFFMTERILLGKDSRIGIDSMDPSGVVCSEYPAKAFFMQGLEVRMDIEAQLIAPFDYYNCEFLDHYKDNVNW